MPDKIHIRQMMKIANPTLPTRNTLRQAQGNTFTGQYSYVSDDATDLGSSGFGLMFYQSRWYDPASGRFSQADTIVPGGVQGLDRYAYVNNSPLNYVDPSGHFGRCHDGQSGYQCRMTLINAWQAASANRRGSNSSTAGSYHHDEDTACTGYGKTYYDLCSKYYFVTIESVESWAIGDIFYALEKIYVAFGSDINAMYRAFGNVTIKLAANGSLGTQVVNGKVRENVGMAIGHTITLTPDANMGDVIHEFGHVFDNHMNNNGALGMIKRFNMGTCSALPCSEDTTWVLDPNEVHTQYGEKNPYEDFADSFMYTVNYLGDGGAKMYISDRRQWYILSLIFYYRYPYSVVRGR